MLDKKEEKSKAKKYPFANFPRMVNMPCYRAPVAIYES